MSDQEPNRDNITPLHHESQNNQQNNQGFFEPYQRPELLNELIQEVGEFFQSKLNSEKYKGTIAGLGCFIIHRQDQRFDHLPRGVVSLDPSPEIRGDPNYTMAVLASATSLGQIFVGNQMVSLCHAIRELSEGDTDDPGEG